MAQGARLREQGKGARPVKISWKQSINEKKGSNNYGYLTIYGPSFHIEKLKNLSPSRFTLYMSFSHSFKAGEVN
jgi:hypothetical protein